MTGYGRGESSCNGAKFTVEISTVNRKQAELSLYLPRELDALENRARDEINSRISRGRIVARVGFSASANGKSKIKIDTKLAQHYARMLDGEVSAVVGTHTHVQTADEIIFPGGTAFLCDAGFTGPHDSVLGRDWEPVVHRFLTSQPHRFPVAKSRVLLQGVVIEVDGATGRAMTVERVSEGLEE